MKTHDLKCHPEFFNMLMSRCKKFEMRIDDRGFTAGDVLHQREWIPESDEHGLVNSPYGYTGRTTTRLVTYLMRGPKFGLATGWVCMSISDEEYEP